MSEPDLVEQTDVIEEDEQVITENQVKNSVKSEGKESESLEFENDKISKREEILLQLDEKFLTGGIRLSIALPSFAFFLFFMAWSYSSSSPTWWVDNFENNLQTEFSFVLLGLAFIAILGQLAVVITHRLRCQISRNSLLKRVEEYSSRNKSTTSLHGYHGLKSSVDNSILIHNSTVYFTLACMIVLSLAMIFGLDNSVGLNLFGLAVSLLMLSEGQHVLSRNFKFNSVKRTGLLESFSPFIHPSTLDNAFYDFISSHVDPFLRTEVEDFFVEILEYSRSGKKANQVREMILLILYRQTMGWGEKEAREELTKILTKNGVESFFTHSVFDTDVWADIFEKAKLESPAFFRLLNRLLHDLGMANPPSIPDLVFEVDMENVVIGNSNLFTIMYNLSDEERVVILRVQSPDFRPQNLSMKYRLPPGNSEVWPSFPPDLTVSHQGENLEKLFSIIDGGVTTWNTLLTNTKGEGTLSVRLEDENGSLLVGKQINVRIRSNFTKRVMNSISLSLNIIGGAGLLLSSLLLLSGALI